MASEALSPVDDGLCYACGERNPEGLRMRFELVGERLNTRCTFRPEHQGWQGMVHGGFLALALDEAMANLAVKLSGKPHVSAELSVRFHKPARTGEDTGFTAWLEGPLKRVSSARAEARDSLGGLLAEASAKLYRL